MVALGFCDELLTRLRPERVLPSESRTTIQEQVRLLLEDVARDELDPDLRNFLIAQLKSIDRALVNYNVLGAAALQRAVEAAFGGAVILEADGKQPSKNKFVIRLGAIAATALLALNIATQTVELAEQVFGALPAITQDIDADGKKGP